MFHVEALPDWRCLNVKAVHDLPEGERERYLVRLRNFLSTHATKSQKRPPSLAVKYLANKWCLQGLDLALKGQFGEGLAAFVDSRPARKLQAGETRFSIPVETAPEPVQRYSFGRKVLPHDFTLPRLGLSGGPSHPHLAFPPT